MSDVWSQYWLQGHPTTFGAYFGDGYTGAIADFITEDLLSNNADAMSIAEFVAVTAQVWLRWQA